MIDGSDQAFARTEQLIDEWQETRSGCLEVLAEWLMTHPESTLDEGLAEMDRRSLLGDRKNIKDGRTEAT